MPADKAAPMMLLVRRGNLRPADKAMARKAGVVVVECDNPQDVRLLHAETEVASGTLLIAALKAIRGTLQHYEGSDVGRRFARAVTDALVPPDLIQVDPASKGAAK